jgi:hypothetical protein
MPALTDLLGKAMRAVAVDSGDSQVCETSRFPHFVGNRFNNGGELTCRPPFTTRNVQVLTSVRD